jgi:nitrous oxide reductase accessory protein NosL
MFCVLAGVIGCEHKLLSGPPTLRLGRDECGHCGMLINEDRCSSALLIEQERALEHVLFDDIGCMLDYEHEHAGEVRVVEAFVHDHTSRVWSTSSASLFLLTTTDRLATPMGSGMVAFADRAGAEQARQKFGGEIVESTQLADARRTQGALRKD